MALPECLLHPSHGDANSYRLQLPHHHYLAKLVLLMSLLQLQQLPHQALKHLILANQLGQKLQFEMQILLLIFPG